MKKLMIVLATIMFACIMQASSVSWNVSGIQTVGAGGAFGGSALSGALVYGFVGTAADLSAAITAAAGGSTTWTAFLGTVAAGNPNGTGNNREGAVGTAITISNGSANKTAQGTFDGSSIQNVYLIVFDKSTAAASSYFMASSLYTQTLGGSGAKTYTFGTPGGANPLFSATKWTPVPEPATFALMGVGLAVFGLRRRFMKK